MKAKIFAVIDTNVLISANLSESGAPYQVMQLMLSGNIIPIFDCRMLNEYYHVFQYGKFASAITYEQMYDTLFSVVSHGVLVNDVQSTKEEMKDETDIPFYEVKEDTGDFDTTLVTGNIKDFPDDPQIITPRQLIQLLPHIEFFISNFGNVKNYGKDIEQKIADNLSSDKYTSGSDLLNDIFNEDTKEINDDFFLGLS